VIEASIEKVWGLVRPASFAWWGLMESSTAGESDAVGATSVQTYKDGSKLTVKLLEMSVQTCARALARSIEGCPSEPSEHTALCVSTTDWRLAWFRTWIAS